MTLLNGGRPLGFVNTVFDVVTVAIWALLLFLVARRSGSSLTRDLF